MEGWVIVYVPTATSNVYQMLTYDDGPTQKKNLMQKTIKTLLTCAQVYWWLRS